MEYELYHHGTKGMRWGIRRYQNKDGTLTPAGKKRYNKEMEKLKEEAKVLKNKEATKAKLDKLESMRKSNEERRRAFDDEDLEPEVETVPDRPRKSVKKMTSSELKERLSRLELEKNVVETDRKTRSKGRLFIEEVLENSSKNIATQLATYAMGTAVNKIAEKAGVKNASKMVKKDDGTEEIIKFFEDIVNPKKGQKDK